MCLVMRLLSCSNPQKVYNKYINDYVYVPCGKCAICRNRRAAHYTRLLERERESHLISFFVTLTYSNENLPLVQPELFADFKNLSSPDFELYDYVSSRERDNIRMTFQDFFSDDEKDKYTQADILYFKSLFDGFGGIPYASKSDIQLFLKRLNKYAHDHYTNQFKNFRYFVVSEYGSTTIRPHFHAIFFVDDYRFADQFADSVAACWKFGRVDSQPVESTACSYVAQYLNKFSDVPYVYENRALRSFFLCSRNPFIGAFSQRPEVDKEIVLQSAPATFVPKGKHSSQLVSLPLESSYQNRLFPKCPSYGSVPDSLRAQFYTILGRFDGQTIRSFFKSVYAFLVGDYNDIYRTSQLYQFLSHKLSFSSFNPLVRSNDPLKWFDEFSFNWLRRLYYFARKVSRQACQFGISIYTYYQKIKEYYSNKDKMLLHEQYTLQVEVSATDSDSVASMYPDLVSNFAWPLQDFIRNFESSVLQNQLDDAEYIAFNNKKTHYKNAYFEKLGVSDDPFDKFLFNTLNLYRYAKKRNETLEAVPA